ncbi:MAG: hypothetical protein ABI415_03510 [Flavitalea sp.]
MLTLLSTTMSRAKSQPLAFGNKLIEGCRVYRDATISGLYYYEPFDYTMQVGDNGQPTFSLLQMRYTGTAVTGLAGHIQYKNILQFKMTIDPEAEKKLYAIKNELQRYSRFAVLKPLPITSFKSVLVYKPVQNEDVSLKLFTEGYSEGTEQNTLTNSYWTERTFTIRLSDYDAQLIEVALKNKQALLSVAYAFSTNLSAANISSFSATLNNKVNHEVLDYFDSSLINTKDSLLKNVIVKANAVPIEIDTDRWPDVVQKIDINEKLPPSYPLFDVYCYDFNNNLRPDLYAKKIEISATSVNGTEIYNTSLFRQDQPDRYVRSIRFPYAVRFDKPYKYRTIEITTEGDSIISDWSEHTSWSDIIDITTKNK